MLQLPRLMVRFIFVLLLVTPVLAKGQNYNCITQLVCYRSCCPGTFCGPVQEQICRNSCSGYPVSCDNPNGVDYEIWRPEVGTWYTLSRSGATEVEPWGLDGDVPLNGSYGHLVDPTFDIDQALHAVFRPTSGQWFVCYFSNGDGCSGVDNLPLEFGNSGDVPVFGDIEGDTLEDPTVWNQTTGNWAYRRSSDLKVKRHQWGLPGDLPILGLYDSDAKADLVVWRNSTGEWYILRSSRKYYPSKAIVRQWGLPGDHPMAGDFDGDGFSDLVVWRPVNGNWYICSSTTSYECSTGTTFQFGLPGDVPLNRDVDGDGIQDYVVWRPSSGTWFHRKSSTGVIQSQAWGLPGDLPTGIGIRDVVTYLGG